ncbi:Dpp4p, partial [Coemansia sp. RSA 1933]
YAELEVGEPHEFGEEDDVRFYQEFRTYDPQGSKQQLWKRKRFNLMHILLVAVGCLTLYAGVSAAWGVFGKSSDSSSRPPAASPTSSSVGEEPSSSGPDTTEPSEGRTGKKLVTYDNVGQLKSLVRTESLDWIAHPSDAGMDGLYRTVRGGAFTVLKVDNATWEKRLADAADVAKAASGLVGTFAPLSWSVSADWEYILFNVHMEKVWRHSVRGTYLVYNTRERTMIPLTATGNDRVQRVEWAAAGHNALFVRDNDLFVTDMMHEIQVTDDGSESVFNGIADWVYEEEVLGSGAASWWAPDGRALAYLRMDDSSVPVFQYELFHPENSSAVYPEPIRLHYPKAGAANPRASLHVFLPDFSADGAAASKASDNPNTDFHPHQITFDEPFGADDAIITSVAWLTDASDRLMVYAMNRVQDHVKVYLVSADPKRLTARVVRERSTTAGDGDGAWIEITPPPIFVPERAVETLTADGYLDLVENGEYTHLALFSPPDAAQPTRWLTAGDYDVVAGSVALDRKTGIVSYISTQASSITNNVYQVALNGQDAGKARALTPPTAKSFSQRINDARNGTYEASFSTGGGFYVLNYRGPQVPWQAAYSSSSSSDFENVLNDNSAAQEQLAGYSLPRTEHFQIANDAGDAMNAMAIYPPDFDASARAKYGVLFRVYGGPNSQLVKRDFALDWHSALVSQQDVPDMQWIVVVVDGRGTGRRGRRFRSAVSKQLGVLEPADQAAAARYMQAQPYVNPRRIAIWGWSYGGYTTSRCIERHSDVFRVGMAVAPVTSWRLYDSVYTERYMKTPAANSAAYDASAVSTLAGFRHARFLIQHGSGDDNVHMQNTLALTDMLQAANVPSFEMAVYADSDHGIYTHGVQPALYARMTSFLFRSFHELENEQFDFWIHRDPNDTTKRAL